jgi:hypothetical protein
LAGEYAICSLKEGLPMSSFMHYTGSWLHNSTSSCNILPFSSLQFPCTVTFLQLHPGLHGSLSTHCKNKRLLWNESLLQFCVWLGYQYCKFKFWSTLSNLLWAVSGILQSVSDQGSWWASGPDPTLPWWVISI